MNLQEEIEKMIFGYPILYNYIDKGMPKEKIAKDLASAIVKTIEKHDNYYDEKGNPHNPTLHEIICKEANVSDCEEAERICRLIMKIKIKVPKKQIYIQV